MMKNRDVFQTDPATLSLLNNGVAEVTDAENEEQLRTLRFELETFVCEGEYERGLVRILEAFLKSLDQPEQPAAWVSGFFGSGKSHLIKMLRYLWVDYPFPSDGAMARGVAHLTEPVKELLRELSTKGKQHGGLHAASGKLGAAARGNVRLGLLGIVFRSAGLPADYPKARFVMWLRAKKLLDPVEKYLVAQGTSLREELADMYVSPPLAQALLKADPSFAGNAAEARKLIVAQYPKVEDVSIDDMVEAIRKALTVGKRFPLTLLALDEIQQEIGEGPEAAGRTYEVQQIAEACAKRFDGKLLLVCTGQSALTGVMNLQKLLDRYRVQIHLQDTDVETVTRRMVLLKRQDRAAALAKVISDGQGEIARHLNGTQIEPRSEDQQILAPDYPLLPTRRRFWEKTLRAVDRAGTAAQLRTQLRIVLEAVQESADKPLGHVIPADVLFDQKAAEMRQTGVLPAEIHETIIKLRDGTAKGALKARLCALIFLIGRLPREQGADAGIRANADTLGDLLVEDLTTPSSTLRSQIPELLKELTEARLLMAVKDEYRLQTRESSAWNDDYQERYTRFINDAPRLSGTISELLATACAERLKEVKKIVQGKSKEARKVELCFSAAAVAEADGTIPVWIRNGWEEEDKAVRVEALQASTDSPTIFAFLPKVADAELKKALASRTAAQDTLDARGTPTTDAGREAQLAIETRKKAADSELDAALQQIFGSALVFQAGASSDTSGSDLANKVQQAADTALTRLYPQFAAGDDPRWALVLKHAKEGGAAPLKAVDHQANTEAHPVCAKILAYIGAGKKGSDIRAQFEGSPYGWPRDAVDGALYALCASGQVRCSHHGKPLEVKAIERTKLNQYDFRAETITLTAGQRMALRGLFQEVAGIKCQSGEEPVAAGKFLQLVRERAESAGGPAPLPEPPSTAHLDELEALSGNELLLELHNRLDKFKADAGEWYKRGEAIRQRQPRWNDLQRLLKHAAGLPIEAEVRPQVEAIFKGRSLLANPNPVPPCARP
jgi:hypothetical protein